METLPSTERKILFSIINILLIAFSVCSVFCLAFGVLYVVQLSKSEMVYPTCNSFNSSRDPFAAALLSYQAGNTQLDGSDEDKIPCNSLYNKWKKTHSI